MLTRMTNPDISILGGVLSGIAFRLGINTWFVRMVFLISLFFFFLTPSLIYLALWVLLPKQNLSKEEFEVGVGQHPVNESLNIENSVEKQENK